MFKVRASRVDENQPEIVEALRRVGATVIHTHELTNAFDLLVVFRGKFFPVEIKNPLYAPKRKPVEAMLTEGEAECKALIEAAGGEYFIWLTADQALREIGAIE